MPDLYPAHTAMQVALAIVEAIGDVCERVAIAGSLRRGRARVHDIDLVVISKKVIVPKKKPTLLDRTEEVPAIHVRLQELSDQNKICALRLAEKICTFSAVRSQIKVDLYLADPQTWPTLLLIRTGSKNHNIRLCQHAKRIGWKLHAGGEGLERPDGSFAQVETEEDIFHHLALPYKRPEER